MSPRTLYQDRWLRFYNDVFYEVFPSAYNLLDRLTFGAWWNLVQRAIALVPPEGRVLEIGFGPGRLQVELARRARLCLGLDLAWGMCRYTRRRLIRAGLSSRLVRGDAFALPYPENAFDTVVSTFAFSGIPEGLRVMCEAARVLSPGGSLVLVDIGLPTKGHRMGNFFARLWERMGDFLWDQPSLMREVSLEVVCFEEFGPGDHIHLIVGRKAQQSELAAHA